MRRYSFPAVPQACLMLAVLSGCGGAGTDPAAISPAAVAPPTGAPPVAQPALLWALEDKQYKGTLRATDPDGDRLTYSIASDPAHATVALDSASGDFTLWPHPNYYGADAFEFEVSDGHGNFARARVTLTVDPVNDAPEIDTSAAATVVAAGGDAWLRVLASDDEGGRVTLRVSQAAGSLPLEGLQWDADGVRLKAPSVNTATLIELLLDATDRTGLSTQTQHRIVVSPVSPSGKLFTIFGSPDSTGLHWVITGDGFTVDQQQDLLKTALAMAREITTAPELALHAAVWNVHVLTAASRDSGVPRAGSAQTAGTAFDATIYCTDVERVACVNWDKVYAALFAEHAPFDEVAVVLNTDMYIGNASASGLVVSRNAYVPEVALHEMGHAVANLADEYVDEKAARTFRQRYEEGQFPNVTTAVDPSLIPWRHWFSDPSRIPVGASETGVGRFEGAFYTTRGFFRPKYDSFMRTLAAPIGEVNAEAWLRAQYRAVPPLAAALPTQRVLSGFAGETLAFEVVSAWDPELLAVRWFVDGLEVESGRDMRRFAFQADGGAHQVRVSLVDRTGLIRHPQAREHTASATWVVSNDPAATASKAQPAARRLGGWIRMRVDPAGHAVLGVSAAAARSTYPLRADTQAGFEYALFDARGELLSQGHSADPRMVRGPLAPPGAPHAGHDTRMLDSGHYLIGIPAGVEVRKLRIRTSDGSMEKAAPEANAGGSTAIEQWLDL